jgi:hypothetical protein
MQMISWHNKSENACVTNISSNLSDKWTSSQKKFHPTVFKPRTLVSQGFQTNKNTLSVAIMDYFAHM